MRKITMLLPMLAFALAIGAAVASGLLDNDSVPLFSVAGSCVSCSDNPINAMQCSTNNTGPICKCVSPAVDAHLSTPSQCLVVRRPFIED